MEVHITQACIGCGLCPNLCPGVFKMLEEGVAAARDEIDPKYYDQVRQAAESCPANAIDIQE